MSINYSDDAARTRRMWMRADTNSLAGKEAIPKTTNLNKVKRLPSCMS